MPSARAVASGPAPSGQSGFATAIPIADEDAMWRGYERWLDWRAETACQTCGLVHGDCCCEEIQ